MEGGGRFSYPDVDAVLHNYELAEWFILEDKLQRSLDVPLPPSFFEPEMNFKCNNINIHPDLFPENPKPNPSIFFPQKPNKNEYELNPQTLDFGALDFPFWNDNIPSFSTEEDANFWAFNSTNLLLNDDQFSIVSENIKNYPSNHNCDETLNAVVEEGILKKRPREEESEICESDGESSKSNANSKQRVSKMETLQYEDVRNYFDMPIAKAAKELNVGLTALKRRCRELNIKRWPHRKIKSLETLIANVKEMGMTEVAEELEEHRKKLQVVPEMELTSETKKLRQACFKANYKKRRASMAF